MERDEMPYCPIHGEDYSPSHSVCPKCKPKWMAYEDLKDERDRLCEELAKLGEKSDELLRCAAASLIEMTPGNYRQLSEAVAAFAPSPPSDPMRELIEAVAEVKQNIPPERQITFARHHLNRLFAAAEAAKAAREKVGENEH